MSSRQVGVLGASSLVGECLLPLLAKAGRQVTAYSRQPARQAQGAATWRQLSPQISVDPHENLPLWICVAPIWTLPEHFTLLESHGVRRVVVLSSTSRFTKEGSSDPDEHALAHRLASAEAQVQAWAESHAVEWVILRPTLIYGLGRDKNIAEISRFIRRFGLFPLLGKACGLRQPIHAQDVAGACMAAMQAPVAANRAYNLSGGETLTYREMVTRVFMALGRKPRLLAVPLPFFHIAVFLLRHLPRYRHWSTAMAERMNRDLIFDHSDAVRDFGFAPRPFSLQDENAVSKVIC